MKSNKGLWITLVVSSLLLCWIYKPVISDINRIYFSDRGDGLQTYYTTYYHVKFDSSWHRVNAMNYPFGENILFTSIHPIAYIICSILPQALNPEEYSIAIINSLMLMSVLICILFLYLVFNRLKIPAWVSIPSAITITLMSPQMNRFTGHYNLAIVFAIPMLIYFVLRLKDSITWRNSIMIFAGVLYLTIHHLYFFVFASIILLSFWIPEIFSNKRYRSSLFHISVQLLLPYLIVQSVLWLLDPATDRTAYPWGITSYVSNLTGIFYPLERDYEIYFRYIISNHGKCEWEGVAYVGLAGILISAFFIGDLIRPLLLWMRKKKVSHTISFNDPVMNFMLIGSIAALIFSFGFPLKTFQSLLQYAGPLKQFRGPGRFAWIFFFMINILGVYIIYNKVNHRNLRIILISGFISMTVIDAYYTIKRQLAYIMNIKQQNHNPDPALHNTYQAILPLPYFHIGSENLWITPSDDQIMNHSFNLSMQSGIPLLAVSSSRTSIAQTFMNYELLLEPLHDYKILEFLNDKPILVMVGKGPLNERESELISMADSIGAYDETTLYSLSIEQLRSAPKAKAKQIALETEKSDSGYKLISYDTLKGDAYKGKAGYEGITGEYNQVFAGSIPFQQRDSLINMNFWMKHFKKDLYPRATVIIDVFDINKNKYYTQYISPHKLLKMTDKEWALCETTIKVGGPQDSISIFMISFELPEKSPLIIDELMFYPAGTTIFKRDGDYLMKNNRYYPIK